jgi:hypothetical protein
MEKSQFKTWLIAVSLLGCSALFAPAGYSQVPINNPLDLSGTWYNPATSGQGLVFDVAPYGDGTAAFFAGWFTFATPDLFSDVTPLWFTLQGRFQTNQSNIELPIFFNGSNVANGTPLVKPTAVGTAHVQFQDCTHATLSYDFTNNLAIYPLFAAVKGVIPLVRLTGDAGCNSAASTVAKSIRGFSGTWYNPATSGQGFVFDVDPVTNGGYFFGGWFYRSSGGMSWLTLQGPFAISATEADIPFYCAPLGEFDSSERSGSKAVQCGTAHIQFETCSTATLTYTFNQNEFLIPAETIPLQRLTPVPADCPLQ